MNPLLRVGPFLIALGFWLWRRRRRVEHDDSAQRTATGRGLCSRAHLIDGAGHVAVSVALEPQKIHFFNSDFEQAVDLDAIETVEYTSDLMTGGIAEGAMLRVISRGRALDFAMDVDAAKEWSRALPPR